eukprot:TRINITY_DN64195_c0_g1_i1.p1 TRINITY_DN64195_c0_g1~~TRINITY_DN64195_c0_g1_i1.p1  ORF type:complete len:748 (+),score=153.89 TRINITY_DN64195_c0_g1_i1:136-2244(+)
MHVSCCGDAVTGEVPVPYDALPSQGAATVLCDEFLRSPERVRARRIMNESHDVYETCLKSYELVREWSSGPFLIAVVNECQLHIFDNFVAHVAAMPAAPVPGVRRLDRLLAITFDVASQALCERLAALHSSSSSLELRCFAPRVARPPPAVDASGAAPPATVAADGDEVPCATTQENFAQGRYRVLYYLINWFQVAILQLSLDLGAPAAAWIDVDVLPRKALLEAHFSSRQRLLQIECTPVQLGGVNGQKIMNSQSGIGYASQATRAVIAEWLERGFIMPPHDEPGSVTTAEWITVTQNPSLSQLNHLFTCLSVSGFHTVSSMPITETTVSAHFVITGRAIKASIPKHVVTKTEEKEYMMKELGMWRPALPWPPFDAPNVREEWSRLRASLRTELRERQRLQALQRPRSSAGTAAGGSTAAGAGASAPAGAAATAPAAAPGYDTFRGYKVGSTFGYVSYENYVEVQDFKNRVKLQKTWIERDDVVTLARWLRRNVPYRNGSLALCHGTRGGREQRWFRELLPGLEAFGTDIASSATEIPNTFRWDFHDEREEWRGRAVFVFSNSLDHSYDPALALRRWRDCLRPDGVLLLEHCESGSSIADTVQGQAQGAALPRSPLVPDQFLSADIYGASFAEYIRLISLLDMDIIEVLRNPQRWRSHGCRFLVAARSETSLTHQTRRWLREPSLNPAWARLGAKRWAGPV